MRVCACTHYLFLKPALGLNSPRTFPQGKRSRNLSKRYPSHVPIYFFRNQRWLRVLQSTAGQPLTKGDLPQMCVHSNFARAPSAPFLAARRPGQVHLLDGCPSSRPGAWVSACAPVATHPPAPRGRLGAPVRRTISLKFHLRSQLPPGCFREEKGKMAAAEGSNRNLPEQINWQVRLIMAGVQRFSAINE